MRRFLVVILLALLIPVGPVAAPQAASRMDDLENALMCQCKDKCGKVLVNCTCDTAKETRRDLKTKLESGLSVQQIVQLYVDRYGETVLSAPTKSGFNLSAWVTPFIALVIGGLGVRQVIRSWTRRPPASSPAGETPSPPTAPAAHSSRVQRELDRLED